MIARYSRPEISSIWSEENRFKAMLEVEILACEALSRQGKVPKKDLEIIRKKAKIDVKKIEEIEKVVKHDVIAFLTQVERSVGTSARYLHMGMTSSDVLDTALAVQLVQATKILEKGLSELKKTVRDLARRYQSTLIAGRTHGVHAEPTTFGIKMAGWHSELTRAIGRIQGAEHIIAFGKISGAVGTFAHIDPAVEKYVCKKLGLHPEPVSTQIIPRDRHAHYLSQLALVACTLERFALEIRHLQRTEVLEAEEPFSEGQRGSSAMPHKRNPIACENICGLARLLRSNLQAALENVALWHERDISHSSVERVILPDATITLDFMIYRMNQVLSGLQVYPRKMEENMKKSLLVLSSQRLMLELIKRGKRKFTRESAYKVVQTLAHESWTKNKDFKSLVFNDPVLKTFIPKNVMEECFNAQYFVRHTSTLLSRAGL